MSNKAKQEPELPTGDLGENPELEKEVDLDNPLKSWFVQYVGNKYQPEGGVVTVAMAVQAFMEEFPEFLMVVAEENWIRGYQQGVNDSEEGVRMALEEAGVKPSENLIRTTQEALEEAKQAADE